MNPNAALQRYTSLVCRVAVLLTACFICLKILSLGYIPPGDARRHAARPLAGRPYAEMVVMRPEFVVDHNPGWEWILGKLHGIAGWDEDKLIAFSMAGTMLAVLCVPLIWMRRPEAWAAAVLVQLIAVPELMTRLAQGRPYLVSEVFLMAVLLTWSGERERSVPWWKAALTCAGFALCVWVHGAWYLWVVVFPAFFLAGRWRTGLWLAGCWAAGTVAGALLTGRPVDFLNEAVFIARCVSLEHAPQWLLVGEFQPSAGEFATLVALAIVYLWRRSRGGTVPLGTQAVFWLIVINWILGFVADRFWADWGMAAAIVWMACEFDQAMPTFWNGSPVRRIIGCGLIMLPLYLDATNDLGRRYTACLEEPFVDASKPELKGWMPGKNGIFYNDSMQFFYNTFYRNPGGDWRYMVGFEPALMPVEDLKIYRQIFLSGGSVEAYEPWIRKMHPEDRLALTRGEKPAIPALEWKEAAHGVWIGRLPARTAPAKTQ
jgi:hypothetical protein